MLGRVLMFIPALIVAALVLLAGWFCGSALGHVMAKLLRRSGLESLMERVGAHRLLTGAGVTKMDSSAILGECLNWIVRIISLQIAAEILGLIQITVLINGLIAFIPNIIVALVILGAAAFFGRILQGVATGTASAAGSTNAQIMGSAAFWSLMGFGIIAALNQLHVAPMVVNTLFIGLVATLVLALGLSFGLGGQDVARDLTREWAGQARKAAAETMAQRTTYRDQMTEPHPSYSEDIVPPLAGNAPGSEAPPVEEVATERAQVTGGGAPRSWNPPR
jgi:hypothetical protein